VHNELGQESNLPASENLFVNIKMWASASNSFERNVKCNEIHNSCQFFLFCNDTSVLETLCKVQQTEFMLMKVEIV